MKNKIDTFIWMYCDGATQNSAYLCPYIFAKNSITVRLDRENLETAIVMSCYIISAEFTAVLHS